jgi:hypothetical protein
MQEPPFGNIFVSPEEEVLVLTGPPARLTGRLELRNPSSKRLALRNAALVDPSGTLFTRQLKQALPPVVLRPDQGRVVLLAVTVNSSTPPGEYRVELNVEGQSRPAILHVTEVFSFTVRPSSIVVQNQSGKAQQKRIVVTNTGNIPLSFGDIGEVDLRDDLTWERAIRIAIEPGSERAPADNEKLVVAVLQEIRRREERIGSLIVRIVGGPVDVQPGETTSIDLDITIPEGLPRSRYRGRAPLLTRDLEILVVPSDSLSGKSEPAETPKKPRPKKSGQNRTENE